MEFINNWIEKQIEKELFIKWGEISWNNFQEYLGQAHYMPKDIAEIIHKLRQLKKV
jgi:hypothetical protein